MIHFARKTSFQYNINLIETFLKFLVNIEKRFISFITRRRRKIKLNLSFKDLIRILIQLSQKPSPKFYFGTSLFLGEGSICGFKFVTKTCRALEDQIRQVINGCVHMETVSRLLKIDLCILNMISQRRTSLSLITYTQLLVTNVIGSDGGLNNDLRSKLQTFL